MGEQDEAAIVVRGVPNVGFWLLQASSACLGSCRTVLGPSRIHCGAATATERGKRPCGAVDGGGVNLCRYGVRLPAFKVATASLQWLLLALCRFLQSSGKLEPLSTPVKHR